uniref:ACYPI001012 protein n=1 Tax=Acyrthosiphon pisum TaxID=7029 RepID=C4WW07_ACYPI|nr:ACYPI001012 [Acyrthosiphon pisum]
MLLRIIPRMTLILKITMLLLRMTIHQNLNKANEVAVLVFKTNQMNQLNIMRCRKKQARLWQVTLMIHFNQMVIYLKMKNIYRTVFTQVKMLAYHILIQILNLTLLSIVLLLQWNYTQNIYPQTIKNII